MASYDSDSDIEQDVTETNVLLGYASKDADEDTISRLGGTPVRPNSDSSIQDCKNGLLCHILTKFPTGVAESRQPALGCSGQVQCL